MADETSFFTDEPEVTTSRQNFKRDTDYYRGTRRTTMQHEVTAKADQGNLLGKVYPC